MTDDTTRMVKQPQTADNKSGEARPVSDDVKVPATPDDGLTEEAKAEQARKEALTERD